MDTFTAIGDSTRRTILEQLLVTDGMSANQIYQKFSVSPPAISQHLKVLRDADLVTVEKKAQQRFYYLNTKTLSELETWVHQFTKDWEKRLDRLDTLLKKEVNKNE